MHLLRLLSQLRLPGSSVNFAVLLKFHHTLSLAWERVFFYHRLAYTQEMLLTRRPKVCTLRVNQDGFSKHLISQDEQR